MSDSSSPRRTTVLAAAILAPALAACSGSGSGDDAAHGTPASDATFTLVLGSDPATLNPLASQLGVVQQLAEFLYDPLVHEQGGKIVSGLASSWKVDGRKVTFTLRPGVTCANGDALTAADVAASLNYVANPHNASPLAGITVPSGARATAADQQTVTLTTPTTTAFLLNDLAYLPIVCASGLSDPDALATVPAGTGPYTLTRATPGSSYTLARRPDYSWGPGGATTEEPGLPATVVARVVSNETTTANLLVTGEASAGVVAGPDRSRLEKGALTSHPTESMFGEFLFNENAGRVTSDPEVRMGLTQALDLAELRTIATAGAGTAPTRLTGTSPCTADTVTAALPSHDVAAASSELSAASGKTLTFVYLSKLGPAAAAAAERAVQMWSAAGVKVQAEGLTDAQLLNVGYKTGDWDIAWVPIDGQNPVQVAPTFSGPGPAAGGNNFAGIHNATYDRLAQRATTMPGTTGCDLWATADSALVKAADVVPFAMSSYPVWGASSTSFDVDYYGVVPMSVRMSQ